MGGPGVKSLLMWTDCNRCERATTRLGVLAPPWPLHVKVIVLGVAASRSSQAIVELDPVLKRVVEEIQDVLGLSEGAVVGDLLAACGMGEVLDDHVAACSARLAEHFAAGARPSAVVFLNERAFVLGRLAGLHDGVSFRPLGWSSKTAVHLWFGALTLAELGRQLARRPRPAPPPMASAGRAGDLFDVLGEHRGQGARGVHAANWSRSKKKPLTVKDVEAHLLNRKWVAPFHPQGPWPFVVVDVDRHNALQERNYNQTMRAVRGVFPSAFVVQSSPSRGSHAYVRLPEDIEYERGALVVRAYVTILRIRFASAKNNMLQAELVEVPDQPTRLPFGLGSFVVGSPKAVDDQIVDFINFVKKKNGDTDYVRAEAEVYKKLKLRGKWSPEHREKIRAWLLDAEVADVAAGGLPSGDSWAPLFEKLTPALRKIVASGVPAFGTRTRWTKELIDALTELAEPELAEELMVHWVRTRKHVSESIAEDIATVEAQTKKYVREAYKKKGGVPIRAWQVVEADVKTFFHALRSPKFGRHATPRPLTHTGQLGSDALLDAAFNILRMFYESGRRTLPINSRLFGSGGQKNMASDIENVLTGGTWLRFERAAVEGVESRIYSLSPTLWPRRPLEPCLHVRP